MYFNPSFPAEAWQGVGEKALLLLLLVGSCCPFTSKYLKRLGVILICVFIYFNGLFLSLWLCGFVCVCFF